MESFPVEILREGNLNTGYYVEGARYVVTHGNGKAKSHTAAIALGHFYEELRQIRTDVPVDIGAYECVAEARKILAAESWPDRSDLQIDLVPSAAETAKLPYEAVMDEHGVPLFANVARRVVLTRRLRLNEYSGVATKWRPVPRVLFIAASPLWAGLAVPTEPHRKALVDALLPWTEPLVLKGFPVLLPRIESSLVVLEKEQATLEAIRQAIQQAAAENQPFTHVHLLAHGKKVLQDDGVHYEVCLERADGGRQSTRVNEVASLFVHANPKPQVMTLAVCDAGNNENSSGLGQSLAHELHLGGIPVVVGSQLPFTFAGSEKFTRRFYHDMLRGRDVREVLHAVRCDLYESRELTRFDWFGLVAYVRLPENYLDHLFTVRLEAELAALKTARNWAEEIQGKGLAAYETVAQRLVERIANLTSFLTSSHATRSQRDENHGLLGSAYKRLAELYWDAAQIANAAAVKTRAAPAPVDVGVEAGAAIDWQAKSRDALEQGERSYREGFLQNLSQHWLGVQHLSLNMVLTGRGDADACAAARLAAKVASEQQDGTAIDRVWACGSLLELELLHCVGTGQASDAAKQMAARFLALATGPDVPLYAVTTTRRQLRRYAEWWTKANGFCGAAPHDLSGAAAELLTLFPDAKDRQ